jgi:hypothetical protein
MTDPSVSVKPPFGSVQQRIQRFRQVTDLFASMEGSLAAILDDERWTDGEKVNKIRNLVTALDIVRAERAAEPADPTGQLYTRADDPTPVSPARPGAHVGDVVSHIDETGPREDDETPVPASERGLVDEAPAVACHTCGAAARVIDGDLVHVGERGQMVIPAHPHDAWVG